jgi:hypothetical protein
MKKGRKHMLKRHLMQLAAGLALLLTLLGGGALGMSVSAVAGTQVVSAHHVLADVDPYPPSH